ncbi:MAG: phospholipid transport system substrate-binding protein, partial [Enterobacterales bacterium]
MKRQAFIASFTFLIFYGTAVNGCSLYISGNDIPEPVQIVESQTNILLTQLSSRKVEFDNDPKSLIYFAKNIALSHWNLQKTSRLMLGKYWNNADSRQQLRFEEEFMRTL